ncbi:MAG: HlyD family efflux transporter periplasmic adaptor subunit [Candidatus Paceibacterota bacterium]
MNNLTLIQKIKSFISNNKFWSIAILIAIIVIFYFLFFKNKTSTETRYVTNVVSNGSVITSVSGSGQIESSDTVDINAKASGDVISVPVKVGQEVRRGQLIASIDSRDARIALETAQLSLDKLKTPNTLSVLQKENSTAKAYDDSWNNVSSFVVDMQTIVTGMDSLNNGYLGYQNKMLLGKAGKSKLDLSEKAYWDAKNSLDSTVSFYKTLSRSSSNSDIEKLTSEALDTAKVISNAVKLTQASFDYTTNDLDQSGTTATATNQEDLTSWTTSVNSYVNSITSSLNSIEEGKQSLADTLSPADPLDLRQSQLNVETKQNAYNDCFVRAPFDGIIATLTAKVGQSASGSIGTLIAKQKIVKIALNEVDIAKIKLGQKATLTFDAIDGLTITGKVDGIDSVGIVSQGVVTYNVLISLDVDDDRVKPGMSVSATIITDTATDVIAVPNSAIKSQGGTSYVEVFDAPLAAATAGVQGSVSGTLPRQVDVTIGLADDTSSEIISGLKVGDIIVTKTIKGTATTVTKSTTPSILGAVSGGGPRN